MNLQHLVFQVREGGEAVERFGGSLQARDEAESTSLFPQGVSMRRVLNILICLASYGFAGIILCHNGITLSGEQ